MLKLLKPKIVIEYNRFLDPIFTFYCQNAPEWKARGWNDWKPPTLEVIKERIKCYKEEWKKNEDKIIMSMCEVLGLFFHRNVIDVHIVSGNPRQFSWPIVIKSGFSPAEFVDTLAHELIHVLMTDNHDKIKWPREILEHFTHETKLTTNHIVVHATLKYIFLDVLNDEAKLKANLERSKKHSAPDYARAWEIVEEVGYKEVLERFRKNKKAGDII
ncbi:MAG: hypothetical protein HYT48_01500 [Candidatus Vogelbacteria bacterium]|nr:hypothetical protein [Candidatus Vogelbacteria bacterium]